MPRLKMLRGPEPGKEIELNEDDVRIGRGRKNNLIIQDNEVSREHCRLVRVLDDFEIHDLGSTNGTFVNGQQVTTGGWLLSTRSIVELGDSITFEYIPDTISNVTTPPAPPTEKKPEFFYLVIRQQTQPQPEIYLLDRHEITIGRELSNDIVVQEAEASRHHLRLARTKKGYSVEDLNSLNGTRVNERHLITTHPLKQGDTIGIGEHLKMWFTTEPNETVEQIKEGEADEATNEGANRMAGIVDSRDMSADTDLRVGEFDINDAESVTRALGTGLLPEELEDKIFTAYARTEWSEVVVHLYEYMVDHDVELWVDQYLVQDTKDWIDALEQAMTESPCLLAVISDESLRQPYVQRAIRHFMSRTKPIVLLQHGTITRMPLMLENIPVIQYDAKNSDLTFHQVLQQIIDVVVNPSDLVEDTSPHVVDKNKTDLNARDILKAQFESRKAAASDETKSPEAAANLSTEYDVNQGLNKIGATVDLSSNGTKDLGATGDLTDSAANSASAPDTPPAVTSAATPDTPSPTPPAVTSAATSDTPPTPPEKPDQPRVPPSDDSSTTT